MNDSKIFYQNVKKACIDRGVKLGHAEMLAGYKAGYLQRACHQRSELKVSCVRKFAKVLGAEMQDLMEGII